MALVVLSACLNRPLRPPERTDPALSLLFGSVRLPSGPFAVDELRFRRVNPLPRVSIVLSNATHFRQFGSELISDGHFLIPNVPPGVYRLEWMREGQRTWTADDDVEVMRIEVTEPGVYDVGSWVVHGGDQLDREPQPDQIGRYGLLLAATRGTSWEEGARSLASYVVPR